MILNLHRIILLIFHTIQVYYSLFLVVEINAIITSTILDDVSKIHWHFFLLGIPIKIFNYFILKLDPRIIKTVNYSRGFNHVFHFIFAIIYTIPIMSGLYREIANGFEMNTIVEFLGSLIYSILILLTFGLGIYALGVILIATVGSVLLIIDEIDNPDRVLSRGDDIISSEFEL